MPAAIYCRISRDRVGAGLGVERQEKDCRALAERLNLTVAAVLVDNDLSAYSGKKRPAYEQLIAGLKAGRYTEVLAWHPDRLHRSPVELERFIDVIDAARATVQTVTAGTLDLSTPTGKMQARIVGVMARHEVEHKSDRIRRKHLELAEKGLPSGGLRAFAYEPDGMTIRESEAVIVRELCSRFLAGDSIHSMVVDLNRRGVSTVTGVPWNNQTLRQVIGRARNAGLRVRHDEVFGNAAWEPIVTKDVWLACRAKLDDPSRRKSFSNTRVHLLSGLALCGVCGRRVRGTSRTTGQLIYKCPSHHVTRDLRSIDQVTIGYVLQLLRNADGQTLFNPETATERDWSGEMGTLQGRMREAGRMFARGAINQATLEEIHKDINEQLGTLAARAAQEHQHELADVAGSDAEARWEALSLDRKRAIINRLVTVTIFRTRKGARFDPASVRIERR